MRNKVLALSDGTNGGSVLRVRILRQRSIGPGVGNGHGARLVPDNAPWRIRRDKSRFHGFRGIQLYMITGCNSWTHPVICRRS